VNNAADIDVVAGAVAFLSISVTSHKYWSATIDGQPAQLIPANIAYQGLFVPRGAHHIRMEYRNPMILIGGVITLLAVIALMSPRAG
jgi:uncharacterized membrane protein YfhO